jgi:hypothetical protein
VAGGQLCRQQKVVDTEAEEPAWCVTRALMRARGEETPSKPESSKDGDEEEDEDEEYGEITPSPHSPPPEDLPSLGYLFSQQTGISVGVRWTRCPGWELGHHLACRHSLILCWYILTFRE